MLQAVAPTIPAHAWLAMYRDRDAALGPVKEGAWRILLDLAANGPCSVTSACIASGSPVTTGLRYLRDLEQAGLTLRLPNPDDRRSDFVHLTDKARAVLGIETHA